MSWRCVKILKSYHRLKSLFKKKDTNILRYKLVKFLYFIVIKKNK